MKRQFTYFSFASKVLILGLGLGCMEPQQDNGQEQKNTSKLLNEKKTKDLDSNNVKIDVVYEKTTDPQIEEQDKTDHLKDISADTIIEETTEFNAPIANQDMEVHNDIVPREGFFPNTPAVDPWLINYDYRVYPSRFGDGGPFYSFGVEPENAKLFKDPNEHFNFLLRFHKKHGY